LRGVFYAPSVTSQLTDTIGRRRSHAIASRLGANGWAVASGSWNGL
jgi:hypothetical protein